MRYLRTTLLDLLDDEDFKSELQNYSVTLLILSTGFEKCVFK